MAINDDGWKQIQDIFISKGVRAHPLECKILDALLGRERLVTRDEIVDHLYAGREDGGPLDPDNIISTTICRARKHLKAAEIPWEIVNHWGTRGVQLLYKQQGPEPES